MGDRRRVRKDMLRSKAEQERISSGFFSIARLLGGYVVLHVPLPFRVPFYDGFVYGFDPAKPRFLELVHYPEREARSYMDRVGEPIFDPPGADEEACEPPGNTYTVARIGAAVPRGWLAPDDGGEEDEGRSWRGQPGLLFHEDPETNGFLTGLLDDGLRALNLLLRAYRIVSKETAIGPLEGLGKLPFALLYTLWDVSWAEGLEFGAGCLKREDLELLSKGLFLVNANVPYDRETLGFEDTARVVGIASAAVRGEPPPFFAPADLVRSSWARLETGEAGAAVVESVTAVETFVSAVLRLELKGRGRDEGEVNKALEAPFASKLRDQLGRKMGFGLGRGSSPTNPVEEWYLGAYGLRGDIVHRGTAVGVGQAREALAQSDECLSFLVRKIREVPAYAHVRGFLP